MKIPFDISKRPQIESGEYKLSFDGKPARIICWDKKMSKDNATLVALIDDGESEHTEYFFSDGLAICATAPALYIITPEPELSEFEKHLKQLLDFSVTLSSPYEIDCIKSEAAELLELARKELEPEVLERLEIAYKNQDEVVYENGKREGKAEALKDLPRWIDDGLPMGSGAIDISGLCGFDFIRRDGKLLRISDIEKLPGFNE